MNNPISQTRRIILSVCGAVWCPSPRLASPTCTGCCTGTRLPLLKRFSPFSAKPVDIRVGRRYIISMTQSKTTTTAKITKTGECVIGGNVVGTITKRNITKANTRYDFMARGWTPGPRFSHDGFKMSAKTVAAIKTAVATAHAEATA